MKKPRVRIPLDLRHRLPGETVRSGGCASAIVCAALICAAERWMANLIVRIIILPFLAVAAGGDLYAHTLTSIGSAAPSPGPDDICHLSASGNKTAPDGLNYHTDNNSPAGQIFTLGNSTMRLKSLAIKTAGLSTGTPTYQVRPALDPQ